MSGPLSGLRVVVTRACHQADELAAPLRERGATVILLPTIDIGPPADPEPLRRAAINVDQYDWIIFSSTNAVLAFVALLPPQADIRARIATVGSATRDCAEQHGLRVAIIPEKYVAESLVSAFDAEELEGRRVLIPGAEVSRDVVADALRPRGAHVEVVVAYRNIIPAEAVAQAAEVFRQPLPDWVTFASSSAVDHLLSVVRRETLQLTKIATIGPITSGTVRDHGLTVTAEAKTHTVTGLAEAIVDSVAGQSN